MYTVNSTVKAAWLSTKCSSLRAIGLRSGYYNVDNDEALACLCVVMVYMMGITRETNSSSYLATDEMEVDDSRLLRDSLGGEAVIMAG